MIVYHGSSIEIKNPNFNYSRTDIDFGKGFYLTEDRKMAEKWAVGKNTSVVNIYDLNLTNLNVVRLSLTKQWLDFVAYNRGYSDTVFNTKGIDVIIGPTADDKMFNTISAYMSGFLSEEQTIKYLNIAGYSEQIVLKTEKALEALSFQNSKRITGLQKQNLIQQVQYERKLASKSLQDMIARDKLKKNEEVSLKNDYTDYEER